MKRILCFLAALAAVACLPALQASTITFDATLTGSQEVPPNGSPATGSVTVIVDNVANSVSVDLTYSGLTAPAGNAHIHCCNGPGAVSPVVIPFIPAGFVTGATSGSFSALFTGVDPAIIAGLENYRAYVNVHTMNFPGGEIRANLTPEPASLALVGLGLAGVALWRRRKRS